MSDESTISYSYQVGDKPDTGPGPAADDGELYAYIGVISVNLADDKVLLIGRHSEGQLVATRRVANRLPACSDFRTLDGHARHLRDTYAELKNADVAAVLRMVRDAGLLTTAADVCERLRGAPDTAGTAAVPTRVFVITCDRPAAVERLLDSMHASGNLDEHEALYLVDDSRDEENAKANSALVDAFNQRSPRAMQYFGRAQQRQLIDALVEALPAHEEGIRFLLDAQRWVGHKTYGLARTFCLLNAVGRRAIVIDDDALCSAVHSPLAAEGLAFKDASREVAFYESDEALREATTPTTFDPLSGHARCLGMELGHAIETLGGAPLQPRDLLARNAVYLSPWHGRSRILITQSGYLGDPGTLDSRWLYHLQGSSAERMLAAPGGWEGAMATRQYWVGQPCPTFTKIANMSVITGLDNSELLPPYFPAFRGEDLFFAASVEHLHPDSVVLDYDWCVPHLPVDERDASVPREAPPGRGIVSREKLLHSRTLYEEGVSAELRLKKLALMIREFASMSDKSLRLRFREEVAEIQGMQESVVSALLGDELPRPAPWRDYLKQSLTNLRESQKEVARLTDIDGLPAAFSEQDVLVAFRELAEGFASGLEAWPSVREVAAGIADARLEDKTAG